MDLPNFAEIPGPLIPTETAWMAGTSPAMTPADFARYMQISLYSIEI